MAAPAKNPVGVLARKAGPFPVYVYAIAAAAAWFLFLRGGSAKAATVNGTPVPVTANTSGSDSGAQQPSGGGADAGMGMPLDLLTKLFGQQQGTIDTLTQQLVQTQAAQAAPTDAGAHPSSQPDAQPVQPVDTGPVTSTAAMLSAPSAIAAAGDIMAPTSYPSGSVVDPSSGVVYSPPSAVDGGIRQRIGQLPPGPTSNPNANLMIMATQTKPPALASSSPAKPAAVHYYTYKSEVPLSGGQTLHFTSEKGYYAA